MKITVFTSNQPRHLYLIKMLSKICDEVYAIQECNTVFPGIIKDDYDNTSIMRKYFDNVISSENKVFGNISFLPSNVHQLAIKYADINLINLDIIDDALSSDVYVVMGASYIKGALIDFLVEHNAYNIHMGVSPYFRGSSTNFWAAYSGHIDMVGATIHKLSKGLDSGDILYHALPKPQIIEPFLLGMEAVRVAVDSLVHRIDTGDIFKIKTEIQNKSLEINYSRNSDFTDYVASDYLTNLLSGNEVYEKLMRRDVSLFKDLYVG